MPKCTEDAEGAADDDGHDEDVARCPHEPRSTDGLGALGSTARQGDGGHQDQREPKPDQGIHGRALSETERSPASSGSIRALDAAEGVARELADIDLPQAAEERIPRDEDRPVRCRRDASVRAACAAQSQQRQSLIAYKQAIQLAFRDVSDALIAYQKYYEVRKAEETTVQDLSDSVSASLKRYRGGIATYLEVLDNQRSLFNAQLTLAQDRGNEFQSLVQLYKALGGGWRQ